MDGGAVLARLRVDDSGNAAVVGLDLDGAAS